MFYCPGEYCAKKDTCQHHYTEGLVQLLDLSRTGRAFREMIDKYEEREREVNRALDCSLDNFIMDMIRRRMMNED